MEIDTSKMEGFGIPQQDYTLYLGKAIFIHKRENRQLMICGKTRPKCELAKIIGHLAATRGYKSRENERCGIPGKEKKSTQKNK